MATVADELIDDGYLPADDPRTVRLRAMLGAYHSMLESLRGLESSGLLQTLLDLDTATSDEGDEEISGPHVMKWTRL